MKKILQVVLTIFFMFISAGCGEQKHDIYILFTNDVHCNADGEIGYAGVKYFKDQYTNSHTYVTLVDCGDSIEGGNIGKYRDGYEIYTLMNDCGYDVAVLGNQDFVYGIDATKTLIEQANFNIVGCNHKYIGNNKDKLKGIKPYVIKRFGNTKVAFIGVMTPDTLIEGKPSFAALLEDGKLAYSFYQDNDGQDLYNQVQKTIDSVRRRVDWVIVVSHLGIEQKSQPYTSIELIENTNGIDGLIDAHSHTVNFGTVVSNKDGEAVVTVSTGQNLQYIGEMILKKDHTFQTALYDHVDGKDPYIESKIEEINEKLNKNQR